MTPFGGARPAPPCLAIDIGATKVDIAVVDVRGTIAHRSRLMVREHEANLFGAIATMAKNVCATNNVNVVGVACAGPMTRNGVTVSPLNIPSWREFALRESICDALQLPAYVEGDARALALAEGRFGAARHETSYLSMVVSTGVGGGIVLNGQLLAGDTGNAGHIGHLSVVTDGSLCSCGSYGCLEAEVSGWAIEAHTGQSPSEATPEVRRQSGELVGRAVAMLCSVLDFQHSYVGGSVARGFGDEFFDAANKSARLTTMMPYTSGVGIFPSELGETGSLLGAALVGWRGLS